MRCAGFAYVAEFTAGRLLQIRLAPEPAGWHLMRSEATIFAPRGVLVTSDGRFAFVSSDAGTITRFELGTSNSSVVADGLDGPRHLTWLDADEHVIVFPQPNPSGTVLKVDLTPSSGPGRLPSPPGSVATPVAGPTPPAPYSIAVLAPNRLLIASAQSISQVDLPLEKLQPRLTPQ